MPHLVRSGTRLRRGCRLCDSRHDKQLQAGQGAGAGRRQAATCICFSSSSDMYEAAVGKPSAPGASWKGSLDAATCALRGSIGRSTEGGKGELQKQRAVGEGVLSRCGSSWQPRSGSAWEQHCLQAGRSMAAAGRRPASFAATCVHAQEGGVPQSRHHGAAQVCLGAGGEVGEGRHGDDQHLVPAGRRIGDQRGASSSVTARRHQPWQDSR
jgi:hypothetical protein